MFECTVRLEFDLAHRVVGHQYKCKYLHGHRYILEVTAESGQLDDLGMVVDFGLLKSVIKKWIDDNLDHNVILWEKDKDLGNYIANYTGQRLYYIDSNPTAENIALHIKRDIIPMLFGNDLFKITKIKLYETPNCFVEVL